MKVDTPQGTWIVRRRWAPRILGKATPLQRLRRNLPAERKRRRDAAAATAAAADTASAVDPGSAAHPIDPIEPLVATEERNTEERNTEEPLSEEPLSEEPLSDSANAGTKRRRKKNGKDKDKDENKNSPLDLLDPSGCFDLDELILVVLAIVAIVVAVLFVIPLLIALGELLIVVVLAALGALFKVIFRRPWIVDAVSPSGDHRLYRIVGWSDSGAARDLIAERVRLGLALPTDPELGAQPSSSPSTERSSTERRSR